MSTSERLIVIQSESPEKFQEEFNAVLDEYADCNLKYEFIHNLGHCAYITYVPRKPKEEHICQEETCGTCYYSERRSDRVKWYKCEYFGAVNPDHSICEHYYPEVANEH